jgi:peptidoglycan-associated lipoprotein
VKKYALTLVLCLISCAKPQYPACEGDADCKEKGEICVDKKCVECKADDACVKKLGAGATCAQNMCRLPPKAESTKDGDKVACNQDPDCKGDEECFGGFCQKRRVAENVNASCRDMNNPGKIALQSVPFDLDQADIRPDAQSTLEKNAACLKQAPNQKFVAEGHCDSRGTVEYNLTLGEQRGNAVVKALERLGVEKKRMRVVSKGKQEPVCNDETDACWSKNRRVDFK